MSVIPLFYMLETPSKFGIRLLRVTKEINNIVPKNDGVSNMDFDGIDDSFWLSQKPLQPKTLRMSV